MKENGGRKKWKVEMVRRKNEGKVEMEKVED